MQEDFHYYATYCAAMLAGYSHEESLDICYSAQFVDLCSRTVLVKLGAPAIAATTQLQLELMDARTDIAGIQDITRIWASFHFLPRDLYANKPKRTKRYLHKYRLICGPNGDLVKKTVELAKNRSLQSAGIAMHVMADTWAHMYFAGTPSLVINDTSGDFTELTGETGEVKITFRHNPSAPDDLENSIYTNSLRQRDENSIMNLGHGRAGHLPDYSFIRYRYMPAWDEYRLTVKDNPSDYYKAFSQMVYAMKYLIGDRADFEIDRYDQDSVSVYEDRIREILGRRRLSASDDWKAFGEELSGETIPDFDLDKYQDEYIQAPSERKDETFIGRFIQGAIAQKTMVSEAIYRSGNLLAGIVQIGGS
ncbi:MAG: hypothetical protein IJS12_02255 [Lachnospiraceae bacterium]|nr:hypothetical protein [Lachnospiraceae bacterium]